MKTYQRHGHAKVGKISPTWQTWHSLRQRCSNKNRKDYKYYGGRGITVCDKWENFLGFLEDMGTKPDGMSIDRIDPNKGYSKENCRWASIDKQLQNRRSTVWCTFNGETLCLRDWCKKLGLQRSTVYDRLKRGWDIEKALFTPLRQSP